jgi:hypothetical protein
MLRDRMRCSGVIAVVLVVAACSRAEDREETWTSRETTTVESTPEEVTRTREETFTTGPAVTTRSETTTRVTTTSGGTTVTDETTTTTRTSTGGGSIGPLRIELDERDCVEGWIMMDVNVVVPRGVGTIRHSFQASCNFTERETFTLGGLSCTAESGMCSNFMGRGRMQVTCSEGHGLPIRAEERFPCPDD